MKDPKPTFTYFVQRLKESHPDLAYIHLVESRDEGSHAQDASEVRKLSSFG